MNYAKYVSGLTLSNNKPYIMSIWTIVEDIFITS